MTYTHRIEMLIRRSDALAIKDALRAKYLANPNSRWASIIDVLLGNQPDYAGDESDRTFIARLTTTPDGSGAVVAVGLGSWLTEAQFQHLKDVRDEIPAAIRDRVVVRAGNPENFTGDFWDWAQSQSTPLYPKSEQL